VNHIRPPATSSRARKQRPTPHSELRRARERRGLSVDDVANQAKIPRQYIKALERGDTSALEPGPFRKAYHRNYRSFLGLPPMAEDLKIKAPAQQLDEPEVTSTTGTIPRGDEIPTLRLILSGFAFTLLVVMVLRVGAVMVDSPTWLDFGTTDAAEDLAAAAALEPAQVVGLRAIEDVRVNVITDEGTIREGVLRGGKSISVKTDGPISIEISDLTRVRLRYNDSRLEPLHNLSKGRRLVFLPDSRAD
jgi:DNA-binding XRE family transcriptional regulator